MPRPHRTSLLVSLLFSSCLGSISSPLLFSSSQRQLFSSSNTLHTMISLASTVALEASTLRPSAPFQAAGGGAGGAVLRGGRNRSGAPTWQGSCCSSCPLPPPTPLLPPLHLLSAPSSTASPPPFYPSSFCWWASAHQARPASAAAEPRLPSRPGEGGALRQLARRQERLGPVRRTLVIINSHCFSLRYHRLPVPNTVHRSRQVLLDGACMPGVRRAHHPGATPPFSDLPLPVHCLSLTPRCLFTAFL